ncbi:iron-containing alcohol dehydrogenase [Lacrimispora sp.]|uniref:iron-containing alcohol dehydrogenase n=1 Tax=Lacrimispora sp. TaxID=2719234 RepID=UPI00289771A0|nr:iron-containing alcohol dehydrogenase [Lacrimispora sp.]
MFDNNSIQIGAGRYFQYHGAINLIGGEVSSWGKRACIVTDETVWQLTEDRIKTSMDNSNIEFFVNFCDLPSTQRSFNLVAKEVLEKGADVVIGLGGGRCIDIAKGASDIAGKRVITVPTSAATCAAVAILYVTYGEDGSVEKSQFLKHEISAVLVDLDFTVNNCPPKYLASGIADAMAKSPEFAFTMINLGNTGKISTSDVATIIADYTYRSYMEKGREALDTVSRKECDANVEDIVCMNLLLTGLISNLSTGGKQLAVAHNFYDAVCCLQKEVRKKYLHGEIVGLAIPLQLAVNGASEAEILKAKDMMEKLGIPNTMEKMGFCMTDEAIQELIDYTHKKTIPDDMVLYKVIKDNFKIIVR